VATDKGSAKRTVVIALSFALLVTLAARRGGGFSARIPVGIGLAAIMLAFLSEGLPRMAAAFAVLIAIGSLVVPTATGQPAGVLAAQSIAAMTGGSTPSPKAGSPTIAPGSGGGGGGAW
jgi:hypothetical protein